MECFLVPQRDLGCFSAGAVAPKPALFWRTHSTPLKTEIPTLSTKSQTFYTKNFFSDSPEGLTLLLGQCAALRSLAQWTTHFLASGKAKNGVFSRRIAHIALFYTINFFSDSPEGSGLLLGQCTDLRSLPQWTTPFLASGKAKNGVFSLRIAHIALFYTINFFFW